MTKAEMINELSVLRERFESGMGWRDGNYDEALKKAIEMLEGRELATNLQQTCNHVATDLISRQAAINAIENTDCELSADAWDELTDAIMQLPSAQLERKGKWICSKDIWQHCPKCGFGVRWIPVSEEMPGKDERVLATIKVHLDADDEGHEASDSYYVVLGRSSSWYFGDPEGTFSLGENVELVAWMPLPERYEGDK